MSDSFWFDQYAPDPFGAKRVQAVARRNMAGFRPGLPAYPKKAPKGTTAAHKAVLMKAGSKELTKLAKASTAAGKRAKWELARRLWLRKAAMKMDFPHRAAKQADGYKLKKPGSKAAKAGRKARSAAKGKKRSGKDQVDAYRWHKDCAVCNADLQGEAAMVHPTMAGPRGGKVWVHQACAKKKAVANPNHFDNHVRPALVEATYPWQDDTEVFTALQNPWGLEASPETDQWLYHPQYEQHRGQFSTGESWTMGTQPNARRNGQSQAKRAMQLFHSGQASSLKAAWAMVKKQG